MLWLSSDENLEDKETVRAFYFMSQMNLINQREEIRKKKYPDRES
jgi:hypothetical protein